MSSVLPFRTRAEVDAELESTRQLWPTRHLKVDLRPDWQPAKHGNAGYSNGCRCSICAHGRREYLRSRGGDRRVDLRGS